MLFVFVTFENYFEILQRKSQNSNFFKNIIDEAGKIYGKIQELESKIAQQYKLLVMGDKQEPITFDKLESDIVVPQLANFEESENINKFIFKLDKKFAEWEGTVSPKS